MAEFDYSTRQEISRQLSKERERRIQNLPEYDMALVQEILYGKNQRRQIGQIIQEFRGQKGRKPSQWFTGQGTVSGSRAHGALLDAFVPLKYQESYLYIIDKLNQFPFSSGGQRRTVRTCGYWTQISRAFELLHVYENMFYCGDRLEDLIYRRLDEEKMDYIGHEWRFTSSFNLIYAAEIDRGNQAVIDALKDLILSENNAAYLDREMILGILRSDNRELHKLICDLLLAARLQEGCARPSARPWTRGQKRRS